ncbi:MAG: hypothetical protein HY073_05725 [Deltaproteobacteria bacterium]|nr:hypothetical protein [Deltaproteobacteria bacterium]
MAQVDRVFLDANILFTAAYNPEGLAASLISHSSHLHIKIMTSRYALDEALYNLQLKNPEAVPRLEKILKKIQVVDVPVNITSNPLDLPADDIPIFQAALETQSSHLLTGDKKAFGVWMNQPHLTSGLIIQTVRQFVDSRE